jgi:hypothetical protein
MFTFILLTCHNYIKVPLICIRTGGKEAGSGGQETEIGGNGVF